MSDKTPPPPPPPPKNDNDNSSNLMNDNDNTSNLMNENKALRKQIADLQLIVEVKDNKLKHYAAKIFVLTFFKSTFQVRKTVRDFFDRWANNVNVELTIMKYLHKDMKIKVHQQFIDSVQYDIKQTENTNKHLKSSLAMTLYFYKWKLKSNNDSLVEERKQNNYQRLQIFRELINLRKNIQLANNEESDLLTTAQLRGTEFSKSLESIQTNFAKIRELKYDLKEN